MTITGSFTIPLDLPIPPARLWPLLTELPERRNGCGCPVPPPRRCTSSTSVPEGRNGGTRLDWTEQYAFTHLSTPDGTDDVQHLVGGTRLRLNGLVAVVNARGAG